MSVWFVGGAVAGAAGVPAGRGAVASDTTVSCGVRRDFGPDRPLVKKMAGHVQPTNLDQTIGASAG